MARFTMAQLCSVGLLLVVYSGTAFGQTGGQIYFRNNSSDTVRVTINYYVDSTGKIQRPGGVLVIKPFERSFLTLNNRRLWARRANFTVSSVRGTVTWNSSPNPFTNVGTSRALVLHHSPPTRYAYVYFRNKCSVPVTVTCNYYIDPNGARRTLNGQWKIRPGQATYLAVNNVKLKAGKFAYTVVASNGQKRNWTTNNKAFTGNALVAWVQDNDFGIRRTVVARPPIQAMPRVNNEAKGRAIVKILGAFVAEAARREGVKKGGVEGFLGQAFGMGIRNGLINSALRDAFPQASVTQRSLMTRYICLVMEGRLNERNWRSAQAREALIRQLQRQDPNFGTAAQFVDFLSELNRRKR